MSLLHDSGSGLDNTGIGTLAGDAALSGVGAGPPPPLDPLQAIKDPALRAQFEAFGDFTPAYGPGFKTTADYLQEYLDQNTRANIPPDPVQPFEVRLGGCRFFVPPINIHVSRSFQTGSLGGGAIRQLVPPKFNSGHSEQRIVMTLYFPNQESVWGFSGNKLSIDFEKAGNEAIIDQYLSSLRGLITAFRYTPILPIKSDYLNSTFNISAVALQNITISTTNDGSWATMPFCMRVDLEMMEFDHSVFLPMVQNLDDAMDWGKYRQYMGRSAYIMEQAATKTFLTTNFTSSVGVGERAGKAALDVIQNANVPDYTGTVAFDAQQEFQDGSNIKFFYPADDPGGFITDVASVGNFEPSAANTDTNKNWWDNILSGIGLSSGAYGEWSQVAKYLNDPNLTNQFAILSNWLNQNSVTVTQMSDSNLQKWIKVYGAKSGSAEQIRESDIRAQQMWYANIYSNFIGNKNLQAIFDLQDFMRGERLINEWEVPMTPLSINQDKVIVTAVTASIANNFARLQLNLKDKPVYQHIGGLGTAIEIDMTVLGEEDLTNLRLMYDTINNLSRIEHGHAVLGFLGVQNVITALVGTKYVVPSSFNVTTINGMPHVYSVKLVFTDFDIFQQKRELLSSEQQLALVEEFGKANPFLRLKQNWGAFNAYPDFPLSVRDKDGNVVGHLDPDYYFKAFDTIDDDIITGIHSKNDTPKNSTADYHVVHHLGGLSSTGQSQSIGLYGGQMDLRTDNEVHAGGACYFEPHAGNTLTTPFVNGCTPASGHVMPTFETDDSGNVGKQSTTGLVDGNFQGMLQDAQYRDKSGRMVRAYPTYMLWLIDEGGLFAGVKLFDNFYGLQSVLDFSFVDNEDVMGTTLILRISNLYSRLSTQYSDLLDANFFPIAAPTINPTIATERNTASGTTNYVVNLKTINLQPGARLHLRCGYGSNPNLLDTIFNGMVTSVESGDILTVTAQSDAIELGVIINNAQPLDAQVLTPQGFVEMGNLKDGDYVIGQDGNPTRIIGIYPLGDREVYKVTLSDGSSTECCDDHLWEVTSIGRKTPYVIPLREIRKNFLYRNTEYRYRLPLVEPVELAENDCPLDPYVIGLLLGDGCLGQSILSFASKDEELVEAIRLSLPDELYIYKVANSPYQYRITTMKRGSSKNPLRELLRELGMLHGGSEKYVPSLYKHNSSKTRLAVLQGLLDTDGTVATRGATFSSCSYQLALDVQWLAKSLGGFASIREFSGERILPQGTPTMAHGWIVYLRLPAEIEPFRLTRKLNKFQQIAEPKARIRNSITSIERTRLTAVQCIRVANPRGLYVTDDFIVTHNTNASGSSGDIDGSMSSGFWMSEPRDLMVRLLTTGGNTAEQAIALATRGMIYSQNRWGIRHFGRVLYKSMTTREQSSVDARHSWLHQHATNFAGDAAASVIGQEVLGPVGIVSGPIASMIGTLWTNFSAKRDYEVFKRNIYPGNGTGIAQYTGGDLGDGGTATAFTPPGVNPDGSISPDAAGQVVVPDPRQIIGSAKKVASGGGAQQVGSGWHFGGLIHNVLSLIGVSSEVTDDVPGGKNGFFAGPFAEVSFRASTYMKTIWDMFLMCGALLPNYIVAVRPFEDRSTIFYGKPHWAYTSGLIPVTTGPSMNQAGLMQVDPAEFTPFDQLQKQIQAAMNQTNTANSIYDQLSTITQNTWNTIKSGGTSSTSPTSTTAGVAWSGGDISSLPLTHPNGARIPVRTGTLAMEMHLPTSNDLQTEINQHLQIDAIKNGPYIHPFYMDRVGGPAGGYEKYENPYSPGSTVLGGDDPKAPGKPPGAFGVASPSDEQYYMNMGWPTGKGYPDNYRNRRIMVYCERTKKAVICVPGDWGPASWTGRVAGVSPDAYFGLGQPGVNDKCWFGFVDDTTVLGPVAFTSQDQFQGSGLPSSGTAGSTNSSQTNSPGTTSSPTSANTSPGKLSVIGGAKPGGVVTAYPSWMNGQKGDPTVYALQHGATQDGIPVDFTNKGGLVDPIGDGAKKMYSGFRSDDQANQIWDEFRDHFHTDQDTVNAFNDVYPNDKKKFSQVVTNFQEFMWTNAYNRGWIVLTADIQVQGGVVGGLASDVGNLTGGALNDMGLKSAGGTLESAAGDVASAIGSVTNFFSNGGGSNSWNFSRAHGLFKVYIANGAGDPNASSNGQQQGATSWMRDNAQAGYSQSGLLGRTGELLGRDVLSHIFDFFKSIAKTAGAILTGVVNTLRLSLMTLTNGLNLARFSGAQANLLNAAFQDSLYYNAGPVGSLMWRCDNPFTREYGEPVVEIREPFQRVHFINSFQHIIANGIIENADDVHTVVTATTDGSHPMTVYFDKGAPTERQREMQVETGLQWQQPSGFLGPIRHPIEQLRSWASHFNNGDNATDAKRVALYHLKESLKNIYQGELIILGNAEIRPHDLIYLGDSYEKMYGMFEVEQVVHQFSPETGFITSITPNAIVMINDPAKWQWGSIMSRQGSVLLLRSILKNTLSSEKNAGAKLPMSAGDLANSLSDELLGTVQYTGGVGGIVKDLGGAYGLGGITSHPESNNPSNTPGTGFSGFGSGEAAKLTSRFTNYLEWPAFAFLRDKIFDAHGCYIQYLNRNGTPMDAGLSYNYGSAVGQSNVWTILGDSLNINIPIAVGGEHQIYTSDVLTNLGWTPKQVEQQGNALSYWQNYTNDQVLQLSGRANPIIGTLPDFQLATITAIDDAVTFTIAQPFLGSTKVRLAYIVGPTHQLPGQFNPVPSGTLSPGDPGVPTMTYLQDTLSNLSTEGFAPIVALRVDPARSKAPDGALLATVFYRVPKGTDSEQSREALLASYATNVPPIGWDDFMSDGNTYTLNWELVTRGLANIDPTLFAGTAVPTAILKASNG